ncbi:GNAT family N-acetyltransferase [Aquiflexum sp.]|uniref:GNAT family N-acetyltransferase n=1 Tax=Aquiflexum sp. TaxID=1872584 RepID=UPI0035941F4F
MELLTKRLKLIPFDRNDLDFLHQTFTDPFVRKYLWDDEIIPRELAQEILGTNHAHFEKSGWGLWKVILKESKEFIGFAGLWLFFEEQQPQLLYGLLQAFTGKGYATEASNAVVDYSFGLLGFHNLTASFDAGHQPSEKVCRRLGMKKIKEEVVNGKPTVFYRLDKS